MLGKPEPIAENTPLVAGKLTLYPDRFVYQTQRHNINDIAHLDWNWSSTTTNAVYNEQRAHLNIHLRSGASYALSKTTLYVKPKLVYAYQHISSRTFESRLKHYSDQLAQDGGFRYQDAIVYSNGTIVLGEITANLADALLHPFSLTIKTPGMFKKNLNLSLVRDRDVVLPLIEHIVQNPQDPAAIRQNYERYAASTQFNPLVTDIVSLMALLSGADGNISPEEVEEVKRFATDVCKLDSSKLGEISSIFNNAKQIGQPFQHHLNNLLSREGVSVEVLQLTLDLLFSLAAADGSISMEEELLILEAEAVLGVSSNAFHQFRNNKQAASSRVHYLNILGLDAEATQQEITSAYRRLSMKYHPDRVHHLGEAYVFEAENAMKDINMAYQSLTG